MVAWTNEDGAARHSVRRGSLLRGLRWDASGLQMRQKLDRIIFDEAHLTITAGDYRRSMKHGGGR